MKHETKGRTMTSEEIVKGLKKLFGPDCFSTRKAYISIEAATLIESQVKEIADMQGALDFGVKCNDDLQAQVESQAQTIAELQKDKETLEGLLNLTDIESENGFWRVSLDYDNYQDGARIINGDGKIIADCYDLSLKPNEQFRQAIDAATKGGKR